MLRLAPPFALILALLATPAAQADSWVPPKVKVSTSAAGTARATITPGVIRNFLDTYDAPPGDEVKATAKVEQRGADGAWRLLWQGRLVNDVAPVGAIVSDDGTRLVTIDRWHAAGIGDEAVVIYDGHGRVVRRWSIDALLSPAYVATLSHSASSIWWNDGRVDIVDGGRALVVQVFKPRARQDTVPLRLSLADGSVLAEQDAAWRAVQREVAALEDARQRRWREFRAMRAAPLAAPASTELAAWLEYLHAVRERLQWREQRSVNGALLDKESGERLIAAAFKACDCREPEREYVFLASGSQRLVRILEAHLAAAKPGSLHGMRIRMSGDDGQVARVRRAAVRSGAVIEPVGVGGIVAGIDLPATPYAQFTHDAAEDLRPNGWHAQLMEQALRDSRHWKDSRP